MNGGNILNTWKMKSRPKESELMLWAAHKIYRFLPLNLQKSQRNQIRFPSYNIKFVFLPNKVNYNFLIRRVIETIYSDMILEDYQKTKNRSILNYRYKTMERAMETLQRCCGKSRYEDRLQIKYEIITDEDLMKGK